MAANPDVEMTTDAPQSEPATSAPTTAEDAQGEKKPAAADKSDSEAETVIISKTPVKMKPAPGDSHATENADGVTSQSPTLGRDRPEPMDLDVPSKETSPSRKRRTLQSEPIDDPPALKEEDSTVRRARHAPLRNSKSRRSSNESDPGSQIDSDSSSGGASDIVARARGRRNRLRRSSTARGDAKRPATHHDDDESADDSLPIESRGSHPHPNRDFSSPALLKSQLSPRLRSSHKRTTSSNLNPAQNSSEPSPDTTASARRRFASSEVEMAGATSSYKLDSSGQSVLHKAAKGRDVTKLRDVLTKLDADFDKNLQDYAGNTALQMASLRGLTQNVELLLKAGCNPNTQNSQGETPLKDARDNDHTEVETLLLEYGAKEEMENPDETPRTDVNPRYADHFQNPGPASLLSSIKKANMKSFGDLITYVKPDADCLVAAITNKSGHADTLVELVVASATDHNTSSSEEKTPLQAAIDIGNAKAIEMLINAERDPADPKRKVPGTSMDHFRYCAAKKKANPKANWKACERALQGKKLSKSENVAEPPSSPVGSPSTAPMPMQGIEDDETAAVAETKARSASPEKRYPSPTPPRSPTPEPPVHLPPGLRSLLGKPLPLDVPSGSIERSVVDFDPLYGLRREGRIWVPSFYIALLKGLITLKEVNDHITPEAKQPMTQEERVDMLKQKAYLSEQLGLAKNFRKEKPDFAECRAHGVEVKVQGRYTIFGTQSLIAEAKEAILGLPEDSLFWVTIEEVDRVVGREIMAQVKINFWEDGKRAGYWVSEAARSPT